MTLAYVLTWISIPFVCATIAFGRFRGENDYYESEDYTGNGTAH